MELRLMVEAFGRPDREVAVDVEAAHPVAELVAALAGHLGLDADPSTLDLYCRRTGAWLDRGGVIATAGLRTGDRVALWDRGRPLPDRGVRPSAGALVDLLVVGGPSAGTRVPLTSGEHRVGSFRYSGILLEDAALSRVHLVVRVSPLGAVSVGDAGSEGGTFVNGWRIAGEVRVEPGQFVVCGRSLLTFQRHGDQAQGDQPQPVVPDRSGLLAFNRPPRVALTRPAGDFTLPRPPRRERGYHLPMSSAIVPLAIGVTTYFAFGRQPYMLLFALFSPLMFLASAMEMGVGGRWSFRRAARRYRQQIEQLDARMAAVQVEESAYLQAAAPDAVSLLERTRLLDARLWQRRPDGADWLLLRVGWCDQPASITLEFDQGQEGDAQLQQEAMALLDRHRTLALVPMTVSLKEAGVLGLSGDQHLITAMARWICMQLAIQHSPQDLVLAAVLPEAERRDWAWLGWLPHLQGEGSPVVGPLVASDRASAQSLVDRLLGVVEERAGTASARHLGGDQLGPSIVVFLREGVPLPRGAVAAVLQQGPAVGVHAVWIGRHGHALPGECGAVVEADPQTMQPVLTLPATGRSTRGGGADGIAFEAAMDAALALAPVRDVSSRLRAAGVPARVQLLELLRLQDDPQGILMQYWIRDRSAPHERDLVATWGMAAGEEPFDVSLRLDGPHALVGGMTGSGKSELLQSLVASLAIRYSPRTLNFLLVDYKGGAAFKDCVDLPHTVGFVTDLDGHLVTRALVSLRAELRRREEILRQAGAKDLLDLEQRDQDRAPASLVIVVDEFAALAAELPEFVDGMVDVAQRGRSLGIHLVLATQRPAGVINDKIRANTNLRVSLRFSDDAESLDVVGTPDAARPGLPPGRAFARVGPGQVIEFQAGYVGGRTAARRGPTPVVVRDLDLGASVAAASARRAARSEEGQTDLQSLVRAAISVNRKLGLPAPARPWLPTLPEVMSLDALPAPAWRPPAGPRAALGLLDDPAGQRQVPLEFGLEEDGGLLVFGSSGSGKTTALRSLAAGLASATSPDQLQVYALDFATRGLKALEALPHCGTVTAGDDVERATRLLMMLRAEAERRKALLASTGAATLTEYLTARPGEPLPRLLVLLDGFIGFASAFDGIAMGTHLDTVKMLVAEGRPLGISWVVASDRMAGPMVTLSTLVSRKLILRMASEDDYSLLGLPRSAYLGAHLPPGRGFTERGFEVQCPIVGPDPGGSAQAAAVADLGAELARRYPGVSVPEIRVLPKEVIRASLPRPGAPLEAVIGVEDRTLEPARVSLAEGHFVMAGPRRSGRSTALATFALSLRRGPEAPPLHLFAGRGHSMLAALPWWASVALGPEACDEAATRMAEAGRARGAGAGAQPAVVVVEDAEELVNAGSDLEWLAQRGRETGLRLVVGIENSAAQRVYGGWLSHVLKDRQGLLLDPDPALDGSIVGGARLPSRQGAPWPVGRAYLVRRGTVELVQLGG